MRIATRTRELDAAACRLHPSIRKPGAFVEIGVADNGVGMSAQTRERLFEPFFTTKESGRGTGLGLAGVYTCVKAHGGGVDVASALGEGTTITLYLPLAVGEVARPPAAAPVDIVAGTHLDAHRRILVVDDEEPVRILVQKVFARAGHQVVTCRDGVEALEVWRRDPGRFDLVILDLVMPRLGGEDVLAAMLAQEPRTRVLVISGYSAGTPRDRIVADGACGFLAKPFRPADLLREAGRILASGPGAAPGDPRQRRRPDDLPLLEFALQADGFLDHLEVVAARARRRLHDHRRQPAAARHFHAHHHGARDAGLASGWP